MLECDFRDEVRVFGVADVAFLSRVVGGVHQQGRRRVRVQVPRREMRFPRRTEN